MSNKISSKKKTLSIVGGLVVIGSIIAIVCGYYGVQNVNELNDKFIQDVNESITKLKDELKTVVEKKYYFQGFTSSDKTGELCLFVSETDLREKIDKIDPKKEVDEKIMESGNAWKGKDTIKFPANALDNLKYEYKQPALFSFGTWFKTSLAEKFGDLCKKYKGAVGDVTKKFVIVTLNNKNIKTYQVADDKKCAVQTIDMEWATEKLDVAKVASFILVLLDGQQKGENGEPSNLQKMEKTGDEKPVDKKEGETENKSETPVTPKEIEPITPTPGDKDQNVKDAGDKKGDVQNKEKNKGDEPKSDHNDDGKKDNNAGLNDSEKTIDQSGPVKEDAADKTNSAPKNEDGKNVENQNNGEKPSGPEIKEDEATPTNPEVLDKQQSVNNEA